MIFRKTLFAVIFTFTAGFCFSQNQLPSGFKNIKLGMSVDEVKDALKKDVQFGYRGDRDVSFLPGTTNVLIETETSKNAPYSYLDRCWFQFYEEKLYVITINIKTTKLDHYSVRQKKLVILSGSIGTFSLSGTFSCMEKKLLEFGRIANAGKNTNFGLGQMDFWTKWE